MRRFIGLLTVACAACLAPLVASADSTADCHIGAYRLKDSTLVDIGPADDDALRWRKFDGTVGALKKGQGDSWNSTFGWTDRPDGKTVSFGDCGSGKLTFDGVPGSRITFDTTNTTFQGRGITLAGRLVLPRGLNRVPIVVLVHGAEHDSALQFYSLQRMFPAEASVFSFTTSEGPVRRVASIRRISSC